MSFRTDIYTKRVRDFSRPAPLLTSPDTPLTDVVGQMTATKHSAVLIVDAERRPLGILTEADVTQRVALRAAGKQPVLDVMSAPVDTIGEGQHLYEAIAKMRRLDRRHMTVVDGSGRVTGIVNLHDAMAHIGGEIMDQIDSLTQRDTLDGLKQMKAAQLTLARQLLEENVAANDIQCVISRINADIHHRAIDHALNDMAEAGFGPPPVDFDVIVMGSGGRGENMIYPDQDNGFVLDPYADADHTEIDGWFIELAERMTTRLDQVGLPLCTGFVMATNPLWRKRIDDWRAQLDHWARKRSGNVLRHMEIICDFACVRGPGHLAQDLRRHLLETTEGNDALLRQLGSSETDHGPALNWFGGFITVKNDDRYRGYVNLKHFGTLPVVSGARLFALRHGIEETSTLARLEALHDRNLFKLDSYDDLRAAYVLTARLLLETQVKDAEAGRRVTNYVHPKTLTRRQRRELKQAFKVIRDFYSRVRFEFAGEVY